MSFKPDIEAIIAVMDAKRYKIFTNSKGHDLNIVGIRTSDISANAFNDWIIVFYIFDGIWNFFAFPATTDPGIFYREDPINIRGTAVMKEGQYRNAYMIGKHRGYKALQQKGPITVYRDSNRDSIINTKGMLEETGINAINIHRANAYRPSISVGKWSAGCQVVQDPDHFAFLLTLCERARKKFGNNFTYTLLEENDFSF